LCKMRLLGNEGLKVYHNTALRVVVMRVYYLFLLTNPASVVHWRLLSRRN